MTPAITQLESAEVRFSVHEYDHGDRRHDFGAVAADQLGLDPDQVFKTIIVVADGDLVVAVVPVSGQVSMKGVGRALGTKRVELCEPARAERATGYVRGGISPFGQRTALRTVVHESAASFDEIYVSGGKRGLDIAVAPDDLVRVLDATVADIT